MNVVVKIPPLANNDYPWTENIVPVGEPIYNQIVQHLYYEAALLDNFKLDEWVKTLAEDLFYFMPIRQTKSLANRAKTLSFDNGHFNETFASLSTRVMRLLKTKSAWSEDPPSRTRRFVTNVMVRTTGKADEFEVVSYLCLTRNRFEEDSYHTISAERRDVLRKTPNGFQLARREVLLDQAVLGMANLAVFL